MPFPDHPTTVRSPRSEVTLRANLQQERILVLELVDGRGLGSRRAQGRDTREFLVEVEPLNFGRERQVLDWGPAGKKTELRDVVVRVAGERRSRHQLPCPRS